MLDSLKKRPGSLRWAPRQRFCATEAGKAALAAYADSISRYQSRVDRDREELEKLQDEWALSFKVTTADAMILGEFAAKDRLPREVQNALEDCGTTLREVQAAVDRLFTAGLLCPVGGGGPLPANAPTNELIDD
jgi:uncharacterized protein YukE